MNDIDPAYGNTTARFYDAAYAQTGASRRDADFYTALATQAGGPVLELGCGTGRVLLEIAARSIGGLCGRTLRFGLLGTSLETTLLRSALGYRGAPAEPQSPASGVMMLPIARAGTLSAVSGQEQAKAVPGIVDVTLTIPIGSRLRPPPEADRYLGFLFASGDTPQAVEESLRRAHAQLTIDIL